MDLLAELIAAIHRDNEARPVAEVRLILLGDLVDRGPASAQVLTCCKALTARHDRFVVLKGNHEAALVDALDGSFPAMQFWMRNGGDATLASCGVAPELAGGEPSLELMAAAKAHVSADTIAWLKALPLSLRRGNCLFVHAGIRPGVPLAKQTPTDLLWIRGDFVDSEMVHPYLIVHGHTIEEGEPHLRNGRLGIDTGAYRTGRLTAVGIEGDDLWTFGTSVPPSGAGERATLDEHVADILAFHRPGSALRPRTRILQRTLVFGSAAALLVIGITMAVRERGSIPASPVPVTTQIIAAQPVPSDAGDQHGEDMIAAAPSPVSPSTGATTVDDMPAVTKGDAVREALRTAGPAPLLSASAPRPRPSNDHRDASATETASAGRSPAPVPATDLPAPPSTAVPVTSSSVTTAASGPIVDTSVGRVAAPLGTSIVARSIAPSARPVESNERRQAVDAIRALRRQ